MIEKRKISNHVIDAIKEVMKDFLIVVFIFVVPLFVYLKVGIKIDNLSIQNYKVDGLYIKLDKKFILKAKKVYIPQTKSKPSFQSVETTFNNIKKVLNYFEYIELKDIEFKNNNLQVMYSDDVFYLSTKDYTISAIVHKDVSKLKATITQLSINNPKVDIKGELVYDFKSDILQTDGRFGFLDSNGSFCMIKDKKDINISIKSGEFSNLKELIEPWGIPPKINVWIVDRVKAKRYKLEYFDIYVSLDSSGKVVPHFDSIKAKAILKDTQIYFKDGVDSVQTKQLDIEYKNNQLFFKPYNPTYKGRDINGSKVLITNLVGKAKKFLKLDLYINSPIDDEVAKILKAYKLSLPIRSDKMQSCYLHIDKLLKKRGKLSVYLESNISKSRFYIAKVPLDVSSGKVVLKDKKITLSNIKLQNKIYDIKTKGIIDIVKKSAKLDNYVKSIKVLKPNKDKIFSMQNQKVSLYISYKKPLKISLASLDIKIVHNTKDYTIYLNSLSKLVPYLKNLPLKISQGKSTIHTKDFMKYSFKGTLRWLDCFFYEKDSKCLSQVAYIGSFENRDFKLYAFDKRLYINSKKSVVKLDKLNIDLDRFFNANIKTVSKRKNNLYIYGDKSIIRYKDYKLITDSYDITIYPNGDMKAIGSLNKDVVKFDKKGHDISIKAYRVRDKMLHPLINFDGLKGGRYTLKLKGNPDKSLKGEILIEGGVLRDFKTYNNTLAFINSLPALATFSNPGFSQKGYEIKEGMIEYTKTKDKINLTSIYIKGVSANIAGKGVIDLKNKTIDVSLAIQVAREFSKVIGSIPVVGYILMGDDKSMTLGLTIKGSLDKPKIETSVAQDILSLPLDMLRRTFGG